MLLRPILAKKEKDQWQEEAQQLTKGEERRISKARKTIRPEWQEQWYTSPQISKKAPKKVNGPKGAQEKEVVSPWES